MKRVLERAPPVAILLRGLSLICSAFRDCECEPCAGYVRQAKLCLWVIKCFSSGISHVVPPNHWLGSKLVK